MTRGMELDLETALRMSGVAVTTGRYDGVVVRIAPRWMARAWGAGVAAMTLPRVVYVSKHALDGILAGRERTLLLHEAVHVDQWRRLGRSRFLTGYLGDYLRGRAVGLPHHAAYRAIRFEREAVERAELE